MKVHESTLLVDSLNKEKVLFGISSTGKLIQIKYSIDTKIEELYCIVTTSHYHRCVL